MFKLRRSLELVIKYRYHTALAFAKLADIPSFAPQNE
jgi:hypothetical protein